MRQIGEFGLIKRIAKRLKKRDASVLIGIGDDAAAINVGAYCNTPLLITTDSLVEDIHFRRDYPPEPLGWKALAVNISDIAAMGGTPEYYLLSLSIPEGVSIGYLDRFFKGMAEAARVHGLTVVGGDTTTSPDRLYISVTVLGMGSEGVVSRKGAQPGDAIFVTGTLGDSALGLRILEERGLSLFTDEAKRSRRIGTVPGFQQLIKRHLKPVPRVKEGMFLAKSGMVTSMIDISDGLLADLGHICEESGVGARVRINSLPLSKGFCDFSGDYGGIELALSGGEDYELLFTVRGDKVDAFLKKAKRGLSLFTDIASLRRRIGAVPGITMIGEIVEGEGVEVRDDGNRYIPKGRGYEHFKG